MRSDRIEEFDGLRGLAAAGVALYHIHPQGTFWMWSFVDLFFVLSGFLITGILLRLDGWTLSNVRNFWMRRILRIWPVYYATLAVVLLIWIVHRRMHGEQLSYFPGFRESLVFMQYLVGDYATLPQGTNYLYYFGHSWSLAVEEQFYLLWPAFLWLTRKNWIASMIALTVLGACSIALRFATDVPEYLLFTRADGLIIGTSIAVMRHAYGTGKLVPPPQWAARLASLACLAIAAAGLWPYMRSGYAEIGNVHLYDKRALVFFFALLYGSIVVVLLTRMFPLLNSLLRFRVFVFLGTISYALYMFHLPIQKVMDQLYNRGIFSSRWIVELIFWILTIGFAALSRYMMEKPLEKMKARFPMKTTLSDPSASAGVMPVVAGADFR